MSFQELLSFLLSSIQPPPQPSPPTPTEKGIYLTWKKEENACWQPWVSGQFYLLFIFDTLPKSKKYLEDPHYTSGLVASLVHKYASKPTALYVSMFAPQVLSRQSPTIHLRAILASDSVAVFWVLDKRHIHTNQGSPICSYYLATDERNQAERERNTGL